MPDNKNKCSKCKTRHTPPTGKKCKQFVDINEDYDSADYSGQVVNMTGGKGSQNLQMKAVTSPGAATVASTDVAENTVQMQILKELQRMNARLDAVEDQVAGPSKRPEKQHKEVYEQSKLSRLNSCKHAVSNSCKSRVVDVSESDSDTDSVTNVPSLSTLRDSVKIQKKVDARLREIEALQETNTCQKIKSKRGGPVEVLVKNKVAWPHEAILGGATRARLTYDQLSMSQWVQGFCRNILDEQEEGRREQMISYMADLMEDATDFSWQGAKAAHAVLCCELERGTVSWDDSARIDRIRRAHAQKQTGQMSRSWGKSEVASCPWFCKYFQNGTCIHNKDHEVGGRLHRHICSVCLQQGKVLNHAQKDCSLVKKQAKNQQVAAYSG